MSRTIDERVLQMKFDNQQFQNSAKDTINTIHKLDDACQMENADKGFAKLEAAANRFMNNYTMVGRVVNDAMDRIASSINNVIFKAKEMASSLTVDQIADGWNKYNDIIASTNTIMGQLSETDKEIAASMGKTDLEYVNDQLALLNQYTDETSYNLTDMTSNVGKFMAAGIDLPSAVSAMEGIGNWAARSGAGINEASRAMYNLSQAMGTGSVKLIDWKSIENANMATKEFKEQVIATAKAMGVLDENATLSTGDLLTYKNFSESLGDKAIKGWFSSDVLVKVLGQYNEFYDTMLDIQKTAEGADMSITQIIDELKDPASKDGQKWIQDFGVDLNSLAAKAFLAAQEYKSFGDAVSATQDAASTSWFGIYQDIFGTLDEAKELWGIVGGDMYDAFVAPIADLRTVFDKWKKLGGRNELLDAFNNFRDAISSAVTPIKKAFADIFGSISGSENSDKASKSLLDFTKKLKDFNKSLILSDDAQNGIRTIFRQIFRITQIIAGFALDVGKTLGSITKVIGDFIQGVLGLFGALEQGRVDFSSFSNMSTSLQSVIDSLSDAFGNLWDRIKKVPVIGQVAKWAEKYADIIKNVLIKWIDNGIDKIKEISGIDLRNAFKLPSVDDLNKFGEKVKDALQMIVDTFKNNMDSSTPLAFVKSLGKSFGILLDQLFSSIKEKVEKFFNTTFPKIFGKDGGFTKALGNLSSDAVDSFKTVSSKFSEYSDAIYDGFTNTNWNNVLKIGLIAVIGTLIIKLKSIIKKITGVGDGLKKTVTKSFSGVIDGVSKVLGAAQLEIKSRAIIRIAAAVGILTASMVALSHLNVDQLAQVTTAMVTVMGALTLVMKVFASYNESKKSKSFGEVADGLGKLSKSVSNFVAGISKALQMIGMGALLISFASSLAILAGSLYLLSKIKFNASSIAYIGVFTSSIALLASVIKDNKTVFGGKEISSLSSTFGSLFGLSKVMLSFSVSLVIFSKAMSAFSKIPFNLSTIGYIGGFVASIILLNREFSKFPSSFSRKVLGMSAALITFASAVKFIGLFSKTSLKGIAVLSASLGTLIIASTLIKALKLDTVIDSIATSLSNFGKVALTISTSGVLIAMALKIISGAIDPISKAFPKLLDMIDDNFNRILKLVVRFIEGLGIIWLAKKKKIIVAVVGILADIMSSLGDKKQFVFDKINGVIKELLDGITKYIDSLVNLIVPAVIRLINTVANSIRKNADPILNAIGNLWDASMTVLAKGASKISGGLFSENMLKPLIDIGSKGMISITLLNKIGNAIGAVGKKSKDSSKDVSGMSFSLSKVGSTFSKMPFAGIKNNFLAIKELIGKVQSGIIDFGENLSSFAKTGNYAIYGANLEGSATVLQKISGAAGTVITTFGKLLPVIGGVSLAFAGLFALDKTVQENTKKYGEELTGWTDSAKEAVSAINEFDASFQESLNSMASSFSEIDERYNQFDNVANTYDNLSDKSSELAETILDNVVSSLGTNRDEIDKLIEKYGSLGSAVDAFNAKQKAKSVAEEASSKIKEIEDQLAQSKDKMLEALDAYNDAEEKLRGYKKRLDDFNSGFVDGISKSQWMQNYIATNAGATAEQAENAWNSYGDYLKGLVDDTEKSIESLSKVIDDYKSKLEWIESYKKKLLDLNNFLMTLPSDPTKWTQEQYTDLTEKLNALEEGAYEVGSVVTKSAKELKDASDKAYEQFKNVAEGGISSSSDLYKDVADEYTATLKAMGVGWKDEIDGAISEAQSKYDEAASSGDESAKNSAKRVLDGLIQIRDNILTGGDLISVGAKQVSKSAFDSLIDSFVNGDSSTIKESINKFFDVDPSDSASETTGKYMEAIGDAIKNGGADVAEKVKGMFASGEDLKSICNQLGIDVGTEINNGLDQTLSNTSADVSGGGVGGGGGFVYRLIKPVQLSLPLFNEAGMQAGSNYSTGVSTGINDNSQGIITTIGGVTPQIVSAMALDGWQIGSNLMGNYAGGLSSVSGSAVTVASTTSGNVATNLKFNGFQPANSAMTGYQVGISSGGASANEKAKNISDNVYKKLEVEDTESIGSNAVDGIVRGLGSLAQSAWDAASGIASGIASTFRRILKINSPSKLTYGYGIYFMQGFNNGMKEMLKPSLSSATSVAEDLTNSFSNGLQYINDIIENKLDLNPTISPVLDLSQIQNGSNEIRSILDSGYSYRTANSVISGFTSPAIIQQQNTSNAIDSAIKELAASQMREAINNEYTIHVPLSINGRRLAEAQAKFNQTELDNLSINANRLSGIK